MRKIIVSFLYRVSMLAPRFFLRLIVSLCFIFMELAWYIVNRTKCASALSYREETIRFVLDNVDTGDKVLEIGPALGHLSARIIQKAKNLLGVEINDEYFEKLKAIRDPKARFIHADAETMEIDEGFDSAVLIHVLEHIKEPRRLLERLRKSAKKLILESPAETFWWLESLRKELNVPGWGDEKHTFVFDYKALKKMLEDAGWRVTFVNERMTVVRMVAV